jgi:hypothetical protein
MSETHDSPWTLERNGDKLFAESDAATVLVVGDALRIVPRRGEAIVVPLAAIEAVIADARGRRG